MKLSFVGGCVLRRLSFSVVAVVMVFGAIVGAARADAGWFESGDTVLRNDLQLLNDAGVIRLPITQWPIPRAAVKYALVNAKEHFAVNRAVMTALERVRGRVVDESGHLMLAASAAGGEAGLLRDFDTLSRENGDVTASASYSSGRYAASLHVGAAINAADDQSVRLDGSHATVQLGNWLLSANALDRFWGPSHESSLILSNNARPMPTLTLERAEARAFETPFLRWLGPWRFHFSVSQMEDHREDIDAPLFMAWRVVVMPFHDIEIGFSRTAQFCGKQLECSLSVFGNLLVGNDNVGIDATAANEPGNQMAGFDLRWNSPIGDWPYAIYSQYIGEDESSYVPAKFLAQIGMEIWKPLASGGLVQGFAEYSSTTCSANTGRGPYYNCAYTQGRFDVEGYRYRGRVIGHTTDADSETYSLGATYTAPAGDLWTATLRTSQLNHDGIDVRDTVSAGPAKYSALELGWKGKWLGEHVSVDFGVEQYERKDGSNSGNAEPFGFFRLAARIQSMMPRFLRVPVFGTLLILAQGIAFADPWLAPGDEGLRSDIQLLADAGILHGPVTTWPLSWPDIARDALGANERGLNDATADALSRIQRLARAASSRGYAGSGIRASGSYEPTTLRTFADTPREEGELSLRASWLTDHLAVNLQGTYAASPDDDQKFRADGSYLGVNVGNFMISAGFMERWWGPGWDGSLILSTNARPIPSLTLERNYTDPFKTKLLSWIGPWRASIAVGEEEGGDVAVPNVRFLAARVNFKPKPWLEFGLTRTAQWCGGDRECGWSTFTNLLLGRDNQVDANGATAEQPGNQMAGYDMRVRSPWRRLPLAFYSQWIGEDEAGGLPSKFLGQIGLETWGSTRLGGFRLRAEFSGTSCNFSRQSPEYNCAYRNSIYPQGYTYRGRAIGHAMDNDGRMYSIGGVLTRPNGDVLSATARRVELNRDGGQHTISTVPLDLDNVELRYSRALGIGKVSVGAGYDSPSLTSSSSSGVRGYLIWQQGY